MNEPAQTFDARVPKQGTLHKAAPEQGKVFSHQSLSRLRIEAWKAQGQVAAGNFTPTCTQQVQQRARASPHFHQG
jgi:hypothetical protein